MKATKTDEYYVLPARELTGSRASCLAQLDEVISGLLYFRRHIAGEALADTRHGKAAESWSHVVEESRVPASHCTSHSDSGCSANR
jgi:hypothetical protein